MGFIDVIIALLQIAAFISSVVFGGRVCDRLSSKWHALIIAGVILVIVGGYLFTFGNIPDEWTRTFSFMALGFAGGLVARARYR